MEKFATLIPNLPTRVISIKEIERVKNYQLALIDFMLYDCPKYKNGNASQKHQELLRIEISTCEVWLKKFTKDLVNDNNRKLIN